MNKEKRHVPKDAPNARCDYYNTLLKKFKEDKQTYTVLSHLMKYGTITNREAARNYEMYRLSDVILRLRRKGADIETVMKEGDGTRYGVYTLR